MPEREFQGWVAYARRKSLPQRRIELMLANIARLIDTRIGGRTDNPDLDEYLFDPPPFDDGRSGGQAATIEAEDAVDDAREFFGFRPVNADKKRPPAAGA